MSIIGDILKVSILGVKVYKVDEFLRIHKLGFQKT